jgi:hypothetical protein
LSLIKPAFGFFPFLAIDRNARKALPDCPFNRNVFFELRRGSRRKRSPGAVKGYGEIVKKLRNAGQTTFLLLSLSPLLLLSRAPLLLAQETQETIVAFRHAEKPPGGMGQLSCKGLNRALALPTVLTQRFGRPDAIYAPNPSPRILDEFHFYFYVRPLATIEPTAISLGMPVNTKVGYNKIKALKTELLSHSNRSKLIFVVWEHAELNDFAKLMLQSLGQDPSAVPKWPEDDYDRIYVFKITRHRGKSNLTFQVDREGLNSSIKDSCP